MDINPDLSTLGLAVQRRERRSFSILRSANNALSILLCIRLGWPYLGYVIGDTVTAIIALLWFVTTDLSWLKRRISWDLVFVILFFLSLVPYIATSSFQFGNIPTLSALGSMVLYFLGIVMMNYYVYYKEDYFFCKKLAFYTIVSFVLGSFQSILGLLRFPYASRILASGRVDTYLALGIGGYAFVFSSAFLSIGIFYLIFTRKLAIAWRYKLLLLIALFALLMMVFLAQYGTTALIVGGGVILSIMLRGNRVKRKWLMFLIILLLSSFFLLGGSFIGKSISYLVGFWETDNVLKEKFIDIAYFLSASDEAYQTNYRVQLYMTSFESFLNNPFFGIYGPNATYEGVGGHSGWLDFLGFYGLFSGIPLFLAIFAAFRKQLIFFRDSTYYAAVLIVQFMYILFGFVKSAFPIYQISFTVFFLVPLLSFLLPKGKKE